MTMINGFSNQFAVTTRNNKANQQNTNFRQNVAHNQSFGALGFHGDGRKLFLEGRNAIYVHLFDEFCDKLVKWGYVDFYQSPDSKDMLVLQGVGSMRTEISKKAQMEELMAKLTFFRDFRKIKDQVDFENIDFS